MDATEVVTSNLVFKRYYLGCLAHASYLIGDRSSGRAAVVDPQRDVAQYLEDAGQMGLTIGAVLLTHFHADFVAGHLELRERVGAKIYLGSRAEAEYPFVPLKDGDVVEIGTVRLKILETPGHTPEGISIIVLGEGDLPYAVLTGDTLFIGDVGRPDLMASIGISAMELAGMLYDSLHQKLLKLPDETLVYPSHGAGSMCGKNLSTDAFSTLGVQKKYNYALQPMTRDAFIALVTQDQPEAPAYFSRDAMLNRQLHPTLDQNLQRVLRPLPLDEVLSRQAAGSVVLDVRDPADFAGAHLWGSLNVGLGGKYATWIGTLLDSQRPMVIVAEAGREAEAATRLGRIGFDQVDGYLQGGMESLHDHPERVGRTERISVGTLAECLGSASPAPFVLDVRAPGEWAAQHIAGTHNIPLNQLQHRLAEVPRDRPVYVHCQSGYRSSIAVSVLQGQGFGHVADVVGGMAAWEASGLPVAGARE